MNEDSRAYVAWTAGRLMAHWSGSSVFDRDRERQVDLARRGSRQPLEHFSRRKGCTVARDPMGTNFCMIHPVNGQHICFTTYDRQFEGFDHETSSHFSGFVSDEAIQLYDYSESKYFVYQA